MAPGLCENCHNRPKFGAHRFCGKTCAAQAATKPTRSRQPPSQGKAGPRNTGHQTGAPTPQNAVRLCKHCGQKPRFSSFDYCGKSCAALAGATQTKPPATQGISTRQKTTHSSKGPPNHVPVSSSAKPHKTPQDASAEEDEEPEEEEDGAFTDLNGYPSDTGSESQDEPNAPQVTVPQPGAKSPSSKGSKPGSGMPRIVPGMCAIPGCGQPAHIDRHGEQTVYCSMKHREEAVKLGLEAACIMCKRYPQSTSNYFCSSACRNRSMTKT